MTEPTATKSTSTNYHEIVLMRGQGWGTGSHETTQLCLQAIVHFYMRRDRRPFHMLDFGSGSGLLSIGAAKLGATAEGIEIQDIAIEHAKANAAINGAASRVAFEKYIDEIRHVAKFDLVIANVYNTLLLEFGPTLVNALAPAGSLVLSGMLATDVPLMTAHYSQLLDGRMPQMFSRGEWRALAWW